MTPPTAFPHSLHLDERQRAMLQAMGVTHWWPAVPGAQTAVEPQTQPDAPTEQALSIADNSIPASADGQFFIKNVADKRSPGPQPVSLAVPTQVAEDAAHQAFIPVNGDAVAEMDWDTLTDTIASCQACGLCQGRKQAVPGTGHRQARWMVVGEAPGEQEDRQGLPFVGPAGQLLDAMLAAMGLGRENSVYIANVIKCRPPHNRNPEPAEVARCQPYLRRQIALVQPGLILAMGRFAAQTMLSGVVPDVERLPLGKLRGQVYMAAGIPVVVTYHPAYLLRNPADKTKVWDDLCLAMDHAQHNPLAIHPAPDAPARS